MREERGVAREVMERGERCSKGRNDRNREVCKK